MDEPGAYDVTVEWVERGPFYTGPQETFEAWTGVVRTPVLRVERVYPEGADREAYEYFNGSPLHDLNRGELLERFPCSIYAAWAMYDFTTRGEWFQSPEELLRAGRRPVRVNADTLPVPIPSTAEGRFQWKELRGLEALRWTEERVTRLLACRDDLWFADELRRRVAVDRLRAGDREGGKAMLREIAERGAGPLAELAAGALRLLAAEEKGEGALQPESGP